MGCCRKFQRAILESLTDFVSRQVVENHVDTRISAAKKRCPKSDNCGKY